MERFKEIESETWEEYDKRNDEVMALAEHFGTPLIDLNSHNLFTIYEGLKAIGMEDTILAQGIRRAAVEAERDPDGWQKVYRLRYVKERINR